MAELGQQTVEFSTLVGLAAEESYLSLKELVEKSKSTEQSDSEKKIDILKFLVKTQQRMLRLNVLSKWCQQVPLIQYSQQLVSTLSNHDMCFTQASDSLFFMHEALQQARAPIYDVPSAIEILLTGNYQRLPKCVEDVGIQSTLREDQQKPALKKLDTLVRSKLLEVALPKEISEVKVSDGTAKLRVDGEFMVLVTLGYRGHLTLWRILHLELLVGERRGLVKLEELRRHALGADLERRMAAAENPFISLYSVLHELCIALVMDTIIRQVQSFCQGRWKDAIRFELVSDVGMGQGGSGGSMQMSQDGETDSTGLRTPGLKILYWLDFDRTSGASHSGSCPFLKIEPGPNLQMKCLHSPFVIDPLTGKEAEFYLDQSCIDVEKLLLRAICCYRYTRLLEIYKELVQNAEICRTASDVLLQCHPDDSGVGYKKKDNKSNTRECEEQEVLHVRAYGSSFFTLGINIRNGHFLLHSSKNIITPSAVLECEEALNQGSMTAAEVFTRLRIKSILHLFACIGRFIGLEVYEHGFAAVKVPKNILSSPNSLLMGFPDSGSSYFMLMQLDKDFIPLIKLLETRPDSSVKGHSSCDSHDVIRTKNVDIGQIQMHEDEVNLSLLDCGKLLSLSPNAVCANQTSGQGLLSELPIGSSVLSSGILPSSFSSIVDEVFDLERGSSAPFSSEGLSSSLGTSVSLPFGSAPMYFRSIKGGSSTHISNAPKVFSGSPHYSASIYSSSNPKGIIQTFPASSPSSGPARGATLKKLPASNSDQELSSLISTRSADSSATINEDQLNASGNRPSRLLSPPILTGARVSVPIAKLVGPINSISGIVDGSFKVSRSSSWARTTISGGPDFVVSPCSSLDAVTRQDRPRKRTASDMLNLIPSLLEDYSGFCKKLKISELGSKHQIPSQSLFPSDIVGKTVGYSYASLISKANKGTAASSIYVSALLHVVRNCSLCIKHARLTSQMDSLDIPYVEEVGLKNASSNLWFRLPFASGDTWQHICLRLGRPGSMYWDVKITDLHFRELWELQKGKNTTPWGSGVRIANTSDTDSHISYDPEGVVLSYHFVEENSIKKLVADIQRLSNARMFALGMRKLLGIRADEKLEESGANSDGTTPHVAKGALETTHKIAEHMMPFSIEAVGFMSLWFSFCSGVIARFVVEWESSKEGCTMHVSPDQLWPHTKFLEDFINGAEVASLLDCIRLTAGPLHALAAATRPARAGPASGPPGVITTLISTVGKQNGCPHQSHLQRSSTSNASTAIGGNLITSTTGTASLGNHNLHGAVMLAASGRGGGPGIVPSSLLPIDVSVVLRGPYWIRIVYRKNFAVDMRCFAGDQVWLQPATPPKGGPSVGGSLPCPQFRPFIMEHVAQELNVLEPNFNSVQPTSGMPNSNSPNPSSAQLSTSSGNRVNLSNPGGMPRSGNQFSGLNRMGNALSTSPNSSMVSSGFPIRRSPGSSVPAHVRGELNTAIIGLGDDGGYGGGWVPLVALKKVLRGILKYLGVLWLFAQLPDILKEILGSILKETEGALLNLDQEQPALRFFVGGYVFAVSVHRVQLLLQVLSVKRFHQSQQQQNAAIAQEELTQSEISEICDYFSRRVASEPYDASRVASFITLLTLPISVLKEFLKLIAWKKVLAQSQGGDTAPAQKPRIELCLENHSGLNVGGNSEKLSASKSNIHYDRPHSWVDFSLTVVLDSTHVPHINAAGGAAWLPYCVSVRLRYLFGENPNPNVCFLGIEGSHGGRACWLQIDDWEKCKQKVGRTVEVSLAGGDISQGRLRMVADSVQRTLHFCLQGLRDGSGVTPSSGSS